MKYTTIIVLDFGSQYNQLIVRRIRDIGVYAELWPIDTPLERYAHDNIKGIILSGGPQSVTDTTATTLPNEFWKLPIPILGICYGMHVMMNVYGGTVVKAEKGEYGASMLHITDTEDVLLRDVPSSSTVWMSHEDTLAAMPSGWKNIASTAHCISAATSCASEKRWTIQFHPEVSHTQYGTAILNNFITEICRCRKEWTIKNYISILKKDIAERVGDAQVLCALSGGVDSAVVATLLKQVVDTQVHCIYVDHGLMRAGETDDICKVFGTMLGDRFHCIDASAQFYKKLSGVSDPEKKRKIVGHVFIETFQKVARQISNIEFLAQGTLYTDIVESGKGGRSDTIKTHHNVGGLPGNMPFRLLEPLNKLYKDEVRQLGLELGLPEYIVYRQPFPGPGISIRIIGEVTPEKVKLVQATDAILREEIARAHLENDVWQYFTVLPGIKSVGVRGDRRSYHDAIIIRAICSVDGMTAHVAELSFDVLHTISKRITNEVKGINRVLYDITEKPPATIEYE